MRGGCTKSLSMDGLCHVKRVVTSTCTCVNMREFREIEIEMCHKLKIL